VLIYVVSSVKQNSNETISPLFHRTSYKTVLPQQGLGFFFRTTIILFGLKCSNLLAVHTGYFHTLISWEIIFDFVVAMLLNEPKYDLLEVGGGGGGKKGVAFFFFSRGKGVLNFFLFFGGFFFELNEICFFWGGGGGVEISDCCLFLYTGKWTSKFSAISL